MIIDLDSHLRDGYFLDEIYQLEEPFAEYTPRRIGDGRHQAARFEHRLDPFPARARKAFNHDYIYDPKANWRGGDIARRQVGGYDMEYRLDDIAQEGIEKQIVFPTAIMI
ncbi:MAG: Amidohydro-rel protein, partial [Chloroflexi bacterium]|nr:Amidohydro-rel protein [Chloroflexota bacterium]